MRRLWRANNEAKANCSEKPVEYRTAKRVERVEVETSEIHLLSIAPQVSVAVELSEPGRQSYLILLIVAQHVRYLKNLKRIEFHQN